MTTTRQRYQGSLLGLAVGDALGASVEFQLPGTFTPVTDLVGGGPFNLPPGHWTDDTSMALCLAESLVECAAFDPTDQMNRYVRWWQEGYLSPTGTCFDIGITVSNALRQYRSAGNPYAGATNPNSAGNGSLMRLAPAPLFFAAHPERAIAMSAQSSRTTHAAPTCLDACRYFGGLIVSAVSGADKTTLLSPNYTPVAGLWEREPLCPEIAEIAAGSFRHRQPPDIVGSGYVVKSLEAALWAFARSDTFEQGCLRAVNLGDDADTTAAIYGQIAGAYYGVDAIPTQWRHRIAMPDLITNLADRLHAAANWPTD